MKDTKENRTLLEDVANDGRNYVGSDNYGNDWYSKEVPEKGQVWVQVRGDTIQNGSINNPPLNWNNGTGYSKPKGVFII